MIKRIKQGKERAFDKRTTHRTRKLEVSFIERLQLIDKIANDCEKPSCKARAWELNKLREEKKLNHDKLTMKWRNKSFYYNKRCRKLELLLVEKGIDYIKELGFGKGLDLSEEVDETENNLNNVKKEKEETPQNGNFNSNSESTSNTTDNNKPANSGDSQEAPPISI